MIQVMVPHWFSYVWKLWENKIIDEHTLVNACNWVHCHFVWVDGLV